MAAGYFRVGEPGFMLINGPLLLFNLAANAFFALCLIFPPRGRPRLKQPLRLLLGCLTWCSLFYSVSLSLLHCLLRRGGGGGGGGFLHLGAPLLATQLCVHSSMTCYVWLNFYYCVQIVPVRRALLVRLRRNAKAVVYAALLLGGVVLLLGASVDAALAGPWDPARANRTLCYRCAEEVRPGRLAYFVILGAHMTLCLCLTTVSSFSTVRYLHAHIRNVARSGAAFSAPVLRSQTRVAATGISQGVLYLLYDVFHAVLSSAVTFPDGPALDAWVALTVTTLYMSGTTVNMGVGQSLYRQTAADVWGALRARAASAW